MNLPEAATHTMDDPFPELSFPTSRRLRQSEEFLLAKHNVLRQFDNVEDFATDETKLDAGLRDAIVHHLCEIRASIAKVLWRAGLHVGISVLDDIIFSAVGTGTPDLCRQVEDCLRRIRAQRPGFVLYPLIEFGMEMPVFSASDPDLRPTFTFNEANFAVATQANSFEQAFENVESMGRSLGISDPLEEEDVAHHARAGNMGWLTRNPLMMVRLASRTGAYYENQFVYTLKIRMAATQVVMLHALANDQGLAIEKFRSSSDVNNWETLDINHYIVGEPAFETGRSLRIRRVPMNVATLELARLSDLAVSLSTRTLAQPGMRALAVRLTSALRVVGDGYLRHVNLTSDQAAHFRFFKRVVTAVDWYRQSFGSRTRRPEATVALAVAFETLLTDHYAPGSAARIGRRVAICLGEHPRTEQYARSVVSVYHERSAIVHTGDGGSETDILAAQAAFALCLCDLVSRVERLGRKAATPIQEMLGDVAL